MAPASEGQGQASGKVILFGEHAVVHGVSAIAAGLDRGATALARMAHQSSLTLNGEALAHDSSLVRALREVETALGCRASAVEVSLQIPAGAGLGASAAMGVATVRALAQLHQIELSEHRLFTAAQAWEKVFHGNPSGIDVAAAQYARPIRFSRTSDPEPILIAKPLRLLVAQAGPPASTKKMVEGVAEMKERNPVQFDKTLAAITALVENATLLLRSGDLRAVGKLMDLNHMLLAGWMLSTSELETACRLAREAGAFGAKLTGAGGGGCVIALAGTTDEASEERGSAILEAWTKADLPCFEALIQGQQLTEESSHE